MPRPPVLRALIRGAVTTTLILAGTALPYTITVDLTRPVSPLPPAASTLFIASAAVLAGAGWLQRRRDRLAVASIAPRV